jgi:hypothetical protein
MIHRRSGATGEQDRDQREKQCFGQGTHDVRSLKDRREAVKVPVPDN